jgi:hypothetical protein
MRPATKPRRPTCHPSSSALFALRFGSTQRRPLPFSSLRSPFCHSERQRDRASCHSERSEESWLDFNLTESDETAAAFTSAPFFLEGKTKRAKPSTDSFTRNHHNISISLGWPRLNSEKRLCVAYAFVGYYTSAPSGRIRGMNGGAVLLSFCLISIFRLFTFGVCAI